jgi:predicted RND superfamily exporter protein
MAALLYRRPVGMLVPLATVTLALIWTLGLFALAGRALNPVTSLMTPVILAVAVVGVARIHVETDLVRSLRRAAAFARHSGFG